MGEGIGDDLNLLSMGILLVLIFALIMIGRFNLVQARPFLSLLGLMCVGLGLYSSYGICGYVGLADNDLNMLLGFLLLGGFNKTVITHFDESLDMAHVG